MPIYVVSGLPRSGTSMMMRMLDAGGIPAVTDGVRAADENNPRGYFELEAAKQLANDATWLDRCQGRAVKIVSALVLQLPPRPYKLIFMRRKLDELLRSQQHMLLRDGVPDGANEEALRATYVDHLAVMEAELPRRFEVLWVSYNRVLADPRAEAARVAAFVGPDVALDVDAMVRAVEPALYREQAAR